MRIPCWWEPTISCLWNAACLAPPDAVLPLRRRMMTVYSLFLEIQLEHNPDGNIIHKCLSKANAHWLVFQFSSHHPLTHEMSIIKSLFKRVLCHQQLPAFMKSIRGFPKGHNNTHENLLFHILYGRLSNMFLNLLMSRCYSNYILLFANTLFV